MFELMVFLRVVFGAPDILPHTAGVWSFLGYVEDICLLIVVVVFVIHDA